jgi:hypothetical protein
MRPDMMAGPMLRKARPESAASVMRLFGAAGAAAAEASGFAAFGFAFWAASEAERAIIMTVTAHRDFLTVSSRCCDPDTLSLDVNQLDVVDERRVG